MAIFAKHSILDVWQDSVYASGLLNLPCCSCKRDTWEGWYMLNWLYYQLHLFWSHTWQYNIQANKRLTKVKEKLSTIKFDIFFLSFIFFVSMSQTISVIKVEHAIFYMYQTSGMCAGMCACNCMHQTGFKLVKPNRFAKISERSKEKSPLQTKNLLDLQIILWKTRRILTAFCELIWLSFVN